MIAQVVLLPTESKKLIAKAVLQMEVVKAALDDGMVVMHPSSSTLFMFEELSGGQRPREWVCGVIAPKGLCVSEEMAIRLAEGGYLKTPGKFPFSYVVRKGKVTEESTPLDQLLDEMTEKDVYIKGVNAVDPAGGVGVLIGSMAEGTIARVVARAKKQNFSVVYPVGLEKLIPIPIEEAAKAAVPKKIDYATGFAAGLLPVPGTSVTEVQAIEILSGAKALPVAAGGLGGAEGATVLVIEGDEDKVNKAVNYVEQVKGAQLPPLNVPNCKTCPVEACRFPGWEKPWINER